ncbi:hypothetical protein bas27_0142 [Escherichia phage TrudiGerster]|uniref:Uncharacterized protein n=1 Tax=Escherichia phage TrudiGerster TaxID=2851991 RepID=A0AAE8B3X7_9CAUD|nr:hypothetical protein bas27_0142 [Escherichia phage TrudiGerster]
MCGNPRKYYKNSKAAMKISEIKKMDSGYNEITFTGGISDEFDGFVSQDVIEII